jgi:hypothetical protein
MTERKEKNIKKDFNLLTTKRELLCQKSEIAKGIHETLKIEEMTNYLNNFLINGNIRNKTVFIHTLKDN